MHGLVALDADEQVLRPAILWNDQRTGAECDEIEERIGFEALVAATGNRALTGFTAPKLLWLEKHEPEVYGRIAHILLPKDYVRLKLSGEHAIDVADASGTLLFDVARADVERARCARRSACRRSGCRGRYESPEVSGETTDGDAVAAGAGDQAAGALGVGVRTRAGRCRSCSARRGVVFAALPEFAADDRGARARLLPRGAGGVARDGRDAQRGRLAAVAARRAGRRRLRRRWCGEAAEWEPGVEGLTFLPYLAGERTPHADPDARGAFAGLSLRHDRGALVRAVLEGVAFGLRDSLDLIAELGELPDRGRVSGGGGALGAVAADRRLRARAAARARRRSTRAPRSAPRCSAAWRAGCGPRRPRPSRRRCARPATVEPVAEWVEAYAEARERFRALYPALRGV